MTDITRHVTSLELEKQWMQLSGYEGIYEIHPSGYIKSLKRKRDDGRIFSERILKSTINNLGYCSVNLYKNGNAKRMNLHRLVAIHFIENKKNYKTVNHKDGNKKNNSINNLEWCSYSQNIKHAFDKLGKKTWNKGNRKERPVLVCLWCGGYFIQKRKLQLFCSRKCTAHRNGNIAKRVKEGLIDVNSLGK